MVFESMGANGRSNQPQDWVVNRSRHAPHLAVAAFANAQFYPCRQDGLAHSHGRLSLPQAGGASMRLTLAGRVGFSLSCTPPPQRRQRRIVRFAFYLHPIGLEQIEARVTDARLKLAVTG